ncbi:hypothetical protein N8772_03870 [Rickettsiales bacterium]|nr:hypothetical protein [Rickettsiales bacterium]MDB2550705.1 hypothetical protein [Rickettsiales bacterium]
MNTIDTLRYSEEFEKVKFTKAQSKALASIIKDSRDDSSDNLVTKNELKLTENAIKAEIQSEINKATLKIIIAIPAIVTFINYLLK